MYRLFYKHAFNPALYISEVSSINSLIAMILILQSAVISVYRCWFTSIGIPIIKNNGHLSPWKYGLYIDTGPWTSID